MLKDLHVFSKTEKLLEMPKLDFGEIDENKAGIDLVNKMFANGMKKSELIQTLNQGMDFLHT